MIKPVEATQRKLFIVGCPRSGTTWVQLLLAQHPAVATAPETQIFAYYLDHFRRQWLHEHEGPGRKHQGQAGLSRLLSEDEFIGLCRQTAAVVIEKIAARKPGAAVVAEKSPRHALEADFIQRVFPDAFFLHVIRDPRDAAASLRAAGASWAPWAPKSAIAAARLWNACVEGARGVQGSAQYREVRYETLQSDTVGELERILDWLGVPLERAACERAVHACELSRLQKETRGSTLPLPGEKSPTGFFRTGEVGGWRRELSASDVRVIEQICGELMTPLGYDVVAGGKRSIRVPLHDAVQRVRESIDWRLQKLVRSV
jgi:hypothetical protein